MKAIQFIDLELKDTINNLYKKLQLLESELKVCSRQDKKTINKKINDIRNEKFKIRILDIEHELKFKQVLTLLEIDQFFEKSDNIFSQLEYPIENQELFDLLFEKLYRGILGFCGLERKNIKLLLSADSYDCDMFNRLTTKNKKAYHGMPHITIAQAKKKQNNNQSTEYEIFEEYVKIVYCWSYLLCNLECQNGMEISLGSYLIHTENTNVNKINQESDSQCVTDDILNEFFKNLFDMIEKNSIQYERPYFNAPHIKTRIDSENYLKSMNSVRTDMMLTIRDI